MRRAILAATALAGLLATSACSTGAVDVEKAVLSNLQGCTRHYTFAGGSGGVGLAGPSANVSATIDCQPNGNAAPSGAALGAAIQGQVLTPVPPAG